MTSSEEKNFSRSFDSTSRHRRSKAQMSVGTTLNTISASEAAAPQNLQPNLLEDEGLEAEKFARRKGERRGLLNIDLNVVPPEDDDFESPDPESEKCGNGQEIRPTAVADVASEVSENKVGYVNKHDLNFNGDCENENGIQEHWSKGETNIFCVIEDEAKQMRTTNNNIIADSEVESEEKDSRYRGWSTLLEVAENALRKHKENLRNKEEKIQNLKPRTSQDVELGGDLHKGTARKKITGTRRQSFRAEWDNETELVADAAVVRSTRGRAVAMPNKYKDSVLDAVAEAELLRHNKSGKSANVFPTKRKSR